MEERVLIPSGEQFVNIWWYIYYGQNYSFDHEYTYDHGLWVFHYCYYVDIRRSNINYRGKYSYSEWTAHYEHNETPGRTHPSYEIRFNPGFNMSGWQCIYKGGTVVQ